MRKEDSSPSPRCWKNIPIRTIYHSENRFILLELAWILPRSSAPSKQGETLILSSGPDALPLQARLFTCKSFKHPRKSARFLRWICWAARRFWAAYERNKRNKMESILRRKNLLATLRCKRACFEEMSQNLLPLCPGLRFFRQHAAASNFLFFQMSPDAILRHCNEWRIWAAIADCRTLRWKQLFLWSDIQRYARGICKSQLQSIRHHCWKTKIKFMQSNKSSSNSDRSLSSTKTTAHN